ncbi:MAG: T9SS type A sorting domain-containing protein, partial [Paludibacteraceae bacterium]|nr:T9SS type A sorting domain-containing protein [Paludibacteraceae bacterium]
GTVSIAKLIVEKGKGSAEKPDITVSGKLTVAASVCNEGTAFICGKGTAKLGTTSGNFDTCPIPTDVEEEDYADLSIYPNPTTSVLYIQSGYLPTGSACIYNVSGKLCKTVHLVGEEITEVSVDDLPAGMYILRLGSQALRFIKK